MLQNVATNGEDLAQDRSRSDTTPKLRGGITGKGFVKGDPRINRRGRPKSFDEARELFQAVAHEQMTLKNGRKMTVAEALVRLCAQSREPALIKTFFEYAFGKVPDKLETTGLENKTSVVLYFDHEVRDNPDLQKLFGNNGR